jgi:hypothetical protein
MEEKTPTVARKVRNRSRNRINHCPESAGKGHFRTPNRPKTLENARFLPETGHFPTAFARPLEHPVPTLAKSGRTCML